MTPIASAQAPSGLDASTPIATDRPAFTNSSPVVPKGVFQAENGFLDTGDSASRVLDFPETLIRVGIGPSTEVRFTAPDYYHYSINPAGPRSGFGDVSVGIKQQIRGLPGGFDMVAVLSLSLPTGANGISSGGYDPSLQVPWSRSLNSKWTTAGMFSVYLPSQNGTHQVVGEATFLVDRQLTGPWDAFLEYAGDFPQTGGPRHLMHFGTAYKISPGQQLDLHVGVGLSPAAVDHFVGFGYSFRFRLAGR
jgi:hypothetical protein